MILTSLRRVIIQHLLCRFNRPLIDLVFWILLIVRKAGTKYLFSRNDQRIHAKGDTPALEYERQAGMCDVDSRQKDVGISTPRCRITGLIPIADTSIEILHTVLLGYVKYSIWAQYTQVPVSLK